MMIAIRVARSSCKSWASLLFLDGLLILNVWDVPVQTDGRSVARVRLTL